MRKRTQKREPRDVMRGVTSRLIVVTCVFVCLFADNNSWSKKRWIAIWRCDWLLRTRVKWRKCSENHSTGACSPLPSLLTRHTVHVWCVLAEAQSRQDFRCRTLTSTTSTVASRASGPSLTSLPLLTPSSPLFPHVLLLLQLALLLFTECRK